MNWNELLCSERIRSYHKSKASSDLRTEFEMDYHRIIGSASFRRLQDKTQVFPLDKSDFIRTRLTHSLEVSSFCKSLGQNISKKILTEIKYSDFKESFQSDVCDILQCAGLIHDIGNPPFGHFGETVIRSWFKDNLSLLTIKKGIVDGTNSSEEISLDKVLTPQMAADFCNFEGNTQALRVVSKLHFLVDEHGMNLTKALLGTIIKYPVSSLEIDKHSENINRHKMGYYAADKEIYDDLEDSMGLNGNRHPLTFVLEAADDIAYLTADIEDSYKKGLISYQVLLAELKEYAKDGTEEDELNKLIGTLEYRRAKAVDLGYSDPDSYAVQNWIISVQGKLIVNATDSFEKNYDGIMNGSFRKELLETSDGDVVRKALGGIANKYAFQSEQILNIEVAADRILSTLLDIFVKAIIYYDTEQGPDEIGRRIVSFISDNYIEIYKFYSEGKSEREKLYLRLLLVTDYVCGMTDSYAKRIYQELSGNN